jgi:hypothetical protein
MPVLDDRELLEEILSLAIRFDRREGAIQVRRIALVAVVFVPRLIRLRAVHQISIQLVKFWR